MDINVGSCLGTLLLILALSADLLTASMVYGAGHIGISLGLTILISGLGSAILGTALFIGRFLGDYFPETLLAVGSGVILIALGTYKTVDFRIRRWRKEYVKPQKNLMLSLGDLRIILNIYGDPLSADEDDSRTLSVGEAILLTIAMSLDGFAARRRVLDERCICRRSDYGLFSGQSDLHSSGAFSWMPGRKREGLFLDRRRTSDFSRILRNSSGNINEVGCLAAPAAALQSSDNWYGSGVAPQTSAESG